MTEAQPAQTTEINDGLHRTNVAVFGLDRPGIVAVVSNALTRRGVNLEQVNQMALHGQFALMCVIPINPAALFLLHAHPLFSFSNYIATFGTAQDGV